MKKVLNAIFVGVLIVFLGFVSLQSVSSAQKIEDIKLSSLIATPDNSIIKEPVGNINNLPLKDNIDIYKDDDPASIVTMYVTVRKGNSSDKTDHTWKEVNDFTRWFDNHALNIDAPKAEAIVQVGDESGPLLGEVGFGEVVTNATIAVRGASSSRVPPKSYKIELRNRAGQWRGQKTIALIKSRSDYSRFRNKLAYDLLKGVPDMVTLRTQFVHLYIKDETIDPASEVFEDYGLFTQVEQPNKAFLRNHLLDADGELYKATFFEFYRYPNNIRMVDDPLYSEDAFFAILETKGNNDHSKLINMLGEVNDLGTPIPVTFEKNFDADNYFTWMAFNILVGNVDTQSQNFYLYSPNNSEKWYFLPWDYDGALFRQQIDLFNRPEYEPWEYGVSNYWGSVLHNRVLREDFYREMLDKKINELLTFLTPERIQGMLDTYRTEADGFIYSLPDLLSLGTTPEERDYGLSLIPTEIQHNYELYLESLDAPMPFFLGTPQRVQDKLQFNWDPSYDFDGQDITYKFSISKDWEFNEVIEEQELVNTVVLDVDMLEPGTYFWRVIATNEDGFSQSSFDHYYDAEGNLYPGMKYLYVTPDGEILEDTVPSEEVITE